MNLNFAQIIFYGSITWCVLGLLVFSAIDIYVLYKTEKWSKIKIEELPLILIWFFIWPLYLAFWIAIVNENNRAKRKEDKNG